MPVPNPSAPLGLQLADLGTDLPVSDGVNGSAVDPYVAPALNDSDQLGGRAAAATAASTSYDTDFDTQPAYLGPKNWPSPVSPVKSNGYCNWHAGLFNMAFCPPQRGPTADGEGPPPGLPGCGDLARQAAAIIWQNLVRLQQSAFAPPSGNIKAANQGALRSLVSRQIPVSLLKWDWYQQASLERQEGGAQVARRSVFGLPLLHPLCGAALGWSTVMLLFDLVFTAFWVPINVAFCLDQYGNLAATCTRTDLAGGIIYVFNILIGFQVGVTLTCGYQARVVVDGRDAARLYASTMGFWLDVLAVVPFVYLVVVLSLGDAVARHQTVSIISLMRLVRLFRVASIIKQLYTSSSDGEFQSSWLADHFAVTPVYMVLLSYMATVLLNLYSCILLLIAYYEQQDGKASWMASVSWEDVSSLGAARKWYTAVYFSITVMTTTGYADFVPKSPAEQVLVTIMMSSGLLIFGMLIALIGAALRRAQARAQAAHDARRKLTHIRKWLQEGEVPDGVQRDVITFFLELGARRDEGRSERDIVFELPAHLRQKVTRHVVLELLPLCPQLAGLAPEVRELVASHCVPLELPTGHDLFRLGDEVDCGAGGLWLLEEGVVCAYRYQERVEAPVGPNGRGLPCLLGEAAVLADIIPACSARMWTMRTERPCRVWQLRGPALRAVMQIYPNLAAHLMGFVKETVLAWLAGQNESEEDVWCEMVQLLKRSFIMGPLRDRIQDCYLALQLANVQDGTLPQLLAAWLDMSVAKEMTLNDEDEVGDDRVSIYSVAGVMAQAHARASANGSRAVGRDAGGIITPAATPERPGSPVLVGRGSNAAGATAGGHGAALSLLPNASSDTAAWNPSSAGDAAGDRASSLLIEGQASDPAGAATGGSALGGGAGGVTRRTSARSLAVRSGLWGAAALTGSGSLQSPLMAAGPTSAYSQLGMAPVGIPRHSLSGYALVEEEAVPALPPAVEQALLNLRSSRPSRPRGLLSEDETQQRRLRRTYSGGGSGGGASRGAAAAFASSLPSPDGSVGSAGGSSVRNGTQGGGAPAAAAAVAAAERSSAPAGRGMTAALAAARDSAVRAAATAAAAAAGSSLLSPGRVPVSPFASAAAAMASAVDGTGDLDASTGAGAEAAPAVTQTEQQLGEDAQRDSSLQELMLAELDASIGAVPATAATQPLKRTTSCKARMVSGSEQEGSGGRAPAHNSSALQRRTSQPLRGPTGLAHGPLAMSPARPDRSLPGEARARGVQRPWNATMGPPPAEVAWRRLPSDSGAVNPAAHAADAVSPTAPPASRASRNLGFPGTVDSHAAAGAAVPPSAPTPPAAKLVRQVSNGHSTFIHKIFLAAGVQLQPMRPVAGSGFTAPAAAMAAATPAFDPAAAPRVVGSACTTCGCVTCAFCARPIVPSTATAAMRPLALQRSLPGRGLLGAPVTTGAGRSSTEATRGTAITGHLRGPGAASGGAANTTAANAVAPLASAAIAGGIGGSSLSHLPPGPPLDPDAVRRLKRSSNSFHRSGSGALQLARSRPRQPPPPSAEPPPGVLGWQGQGRILTDGGRYGGYASGGIAMARLGAAGGPKVSPGAALAAAAESISEIPEVMDEKTAAMRVSASQMLSGTMRLI